VTTLPATSIQLSTAQPTTNQPSARDRLIAATKQLVSVHGFDVSVRQIAAAAGVTHGLVLHHFGGKDGLIAEVNQSILDQASHLMAALPATQDDDALADFGRLLERFVSETPEISGYLARVMTRQDNQAVVLFNGMTDRICQALTRLTDAGVVDHIADIEMRALQLATMEFGLLMLAPLVAQRVGCTSIHDPGFVQRWFRGELTLFGLGTF
jgi:TetR/AcrR family transcriptional regulator, regulator of cefoperazone and chloramphenicol sensitivity